MTEQEIRQDIRDHIKQAIAEQRVMLFMKGTPEQPRCGFSARMVGMLDSLGTDYAAMDILPHPFIREELSEISGWPTAASSRQRARWYRGRGPSCAHRRY